MIQGDLHVDSDIAPLTSPSEFFSSLLEAHGPMRPLNVTLAAKPELGGNAF